MVGIRIVSFWGPGLFSGANLLLVLGSVIHPRFLQQSIRTRPSMSHTNGISELGPQYSKKNTGEMPSDLLSCFFLIYHLRPKVKKSSGKKDASLSCAYVHGWLTSSCSHPEIPRLNGSLKSNGEKKTLKKNVPELRGFIKQTVSIT